MDIGPVVENLMKLGLNEYEARVYAAGVALGPAKARRVHEVSEVPRSRVYDVLDSLVDRGIMNVAPSQPRMYWAVPPASAVEQLREEYIQAGQEAIEQLEGLSVDEPPAYEPVWTLRGQQNIHDTLDRIISSAEDTIHIGLNNPTHLDPHLDSLTRALERGVSVKVVLIGPHDAEAREKLRPLRAKVLSADQAGVFEQMLFGHYSAGEDGVPIRVFMVVAVDGRRSMFLYEESTEKRAGIILTIPFLAMFQRVFFDHMYQGE